MGGLTHEAVSAKIQVRPLSITVSTTGFHPVNAGSTPAEVTTDFRSPLLMGIFCASRICYNMSTTPSFNG